MGIYSPGAGSSSGNPYQEMHDDALPPGAAPAYPTPAPSTANNANLASASATVAPSADYPTAASSVPTAGAVYYPSTNAPGGSAHGGSFAAPAMAIPVHSTPMHFAPPPMSGVPPGPDEGPWSDRCCETRCCCGACHECCYPADKCCRCPPWFLVTAYVIVCVSFLVNFGALAPFYRAHAEVALTRAAAFHEGWTLDVAAESLWDDADEHFLHVETHFDGEGLGAARSLSTGDGEDVQGSWHSVWTATDGLDCARVEAFYAGGRPAARGDDWSYDDDDEDEDDDDDECDEDECDEDEDDDDDDDYPYGDFSSWDEYAECWEAGTCSASELDYRGIWPSDASVGSVATRGACEDVKRRLKSAGGAEVAIRALTFPLGFVLVALFGVLVSRCSQDCRRNACHAHLPNIGRASFYLLAFIVFVDLVCFAHYANTFPDMRDLKNGEGYSTVPSTIFALLLPTLVYDLQVVAVGKLDWFEVDRGGFGVSVFVWIVHVVALLLVALAARSDTNAAFDRYSGPSFSRSAQTKGWGRWYRPERENDPMPPDVRTSAPNAQQMPQYPAVHRTF